jgi:IclR family KDG regulon transcriptional repressor
MTNDYRIAVVDRTLDLIEAIAAASEPVGVTELAREIGATKSAVFRILVNLERRGYITRDPVTSKCQLGVQLVHLGYQATRSIDLRARARPVLEDLHARFNETVNLGILVGNHISYVDMIESDHGLRMAATIGGTEPMHSTSLGKAVLSFLPEQEREAILARPLIRITERTITDPELLRADLARIRESGISEDRGENEIGARCFGSPIFDHRGRVIAAVSVSSPESRFDVVRFDEIPRAVREAAMAITAAIGGVWQQGKMG